jgi:phosphate transport system protein
MMQTGRRRFHDEMDALVAQLASLGELALRSVRDGFESLARRDQALADQVIAGDDEIDRLYLDIEHRILDLLALQTPVASDLRLVSAVLHTNLHLERVGDIAVNIAKFGKLTLDWPSNDSVIEQLREMSDIAVNMVRVAMSSFVRRDLELALSLPQLDDPVDRLNRGMYREVARLAMDADPRALEWGIHMNTVSRQLERVADHAVDIGEQVAFLLTGEFREFTDASHPVAP